MDPMIERHAAMARGLAERLGLDQAAPMPCHPVGGRLPHTTRLRSQARAGRLDRDVVESVLTAAGQTRTDDTAPPLVYRRARWRSSG